MTEEKRFERFEQDLQICLNKLEERVIKPKKILMNRFIAKNVVLEICEVDSETHRENIVYSYYGLEVECHDILPDFQCIIVDSIGQKYDLESLLRPKYKTYMEYMKGIMK